MTERQEFELTYAIRLVGDTSGKERVFSKRLSTSYKDKDGTVRGELRAEGIDPKIQALAYLHEIRSSFRVPGKIQYEVLYRGFKPLNKTPADLAVSTDVNQGALEGKVK